MSMPTGRALLSTYCPAKRGGPSLSVLSQHGEAQLKLHLISICTTPKLSA